MDMIIPKQKLMEAKLFENMTNDSQYQPAGVDVTLKEVYVFNEAGVIDFDNSKRKISNVVPLFFNNDEVYLEKGAYKVIFNEYVRIPSNTAAFCFPRSSLLRCGATLECAVWDPGYEGRSEAMLVVNNPHGLHLKKGAKIGQMVFIALSETAKEVYKGRYRGENR
ncbi:MAG: deoxyuridine 5'-triphosphate nucleotidohydrolase [Candidatus Micrarchaeia archaeon]